MRKLFLSLFLFLSATAFAQSHSTFTIVPLGGTAGLTITGTSPTLTTYITIPGDNIGLDYAALEGLLVVTAVGGSGTNPTLDVSIESSMDNFATASGIKTVVSWTQLTTAIGAEVKVARRTYSGSVIFFGKNQRVKVVAHSDTATKTYTGKLYLGHFRD